MNSGGSGEKTLEFGEKQFGEGEEAREVENGRGNKRIKEMPIDRFGELPDSLLIHILSFLNVKEAAITCVLSKRWQFLWAELPRLEFRPELSRLDDMGDSGAMIEKVRNFVSWVNRTLAVRTVNYLEKFDVSFFYYKRFFSDLDAWVKFTVDNKVKKLNLHIYSLDVLYALPKEMYSCSSLMTLHVIGCLMDFKRTIEWKSLTDLHLQVVRVDQRLLDEILSTCPVLYTLYLERCRGFEHLEVNSPSLHSLSIVDCEYEDAASLLLKISAPYIHSLKISMPVVGRKLQIENVSSLVRADIDYLEFSWNSMSLGVMSGARALLESLQHVKELYVGLQFSKVVSMMVVFGWPLPQSKRELLAVASDSENEHSISGILVLLESSPNLEILVIEGCTTEGEDVILEPIADDDLNSDLLHLKTIRVTNSADSNGEPILTLARILLKRATALEEMVIRTGVKDLSDFEHCLLVRDPQQTPKSILFNDRVIFGAKSVTRDNFSYIYSYILFMLPKLPLLVFFACKIYSIFEGIFKLIHKLCIIVWLRLIPTIQESLQLRISFTIFWFLTTVLYQYSD